MSKKRRASRQTTNNNLTTNPKSDEDWKAEVAKKLTSPMAFVIIAVLAGGEVLVRYYRAQAANHDPLIKYTDYMFFAFIASVIFAILVHTRLSALKEKRERLQSALSSETTTGI